MMKKKVAKGLLVAVVASNQVLGSVVAANGMANATDAPEIILETSENTDVTTEEQSPFVPEETEGTGTDVSEETNSSDIAEEQSPVVPDETEGTGTDVSEETDSADITEEQSPVVPNEAEGTGTDGSKETDSSTITEDSETDEEVSEVSIDVQKTPRVKSSSQIQPANTSYVSDENGLRAALNSGDTQVILEQDITSVSYTHLTLPTMAVV